MIKVEEEKMILQDKKMTNELKLADVDDKYKRKKEKCLTILKNFKISRKEGDASLLCI